jgi:tRNA(fMet)-specific endonuclease VapC
MLRFLFDTDHLTLLQHRHALLLNRLASQPPDAVGVNAVTVEESLRGRLAALSQARDGPMRILQYRHLLETLELLNRFPPVPFDQAAEDRYQHLLALRLRIGTQDLKIAAIALANNLVLLTRNRRDFGRVPALTLDDWSL